MSETKGPIKHRGGRADPTESQVQSVLTRILDQDGVDLVIRLTLVMTLLFPGDLWFHRTYMRILAVWGFIHRPTSQSQWFWFLLFLLNFAVQNLYNWALCDNHKWLYSYWYLALGLSIGCRGPARALAVNARLIMGLTFVFATLRKVLASEYVSGAAFRFLLLNDSRFFEVTKILGGYTQDGSIWRAMRELDLAVPLPQTPDLTWVVLLLTWWALTIESALATLFLIGEKRWAIHARDLLLLIFIATTYPITPVIGFAWVLLIMGFSQCPKEMCKMRVGYLVSLVLVYAFQAEALKVSLIKWIFGREFYAHWS